MDTFGVLFGRLVREKRGVEGLSQDGLALQTGLTKARISEIETGKVANPQARTVDALCVALSITREERADCYSAGIVSLPPGLLEKLAEQFGHNLPGVSEAELEAFLVAKADEFHEMRQRLESIADTEGRITELVRAAEATLAEGDFIATDTLLRDAEMVQLQTSTIQALKRQAQLRIERGNAALVAGDVTTAMRHFERSSRYFSGVDRNAEAANRHDCVQLLRAYGYRYRSPTALYAAKEALEQNLGVWTKDDHAENWCMTKNALGAVSTRLAQFDKPENSVSHLVAAKGHNEDVLALCSEQFLPGSFATASADLAMVFCDPRLAGSDTERERNLHRALSLQMSALPLFPKSKDPKSWGILQHNLACTYIELAELGTDEAKSEQDLKNAIRHAERSFEVRNPDESLQYWVASCRTLGEALLNMSKYSANAGMDQVRRASDVLNGAAAKICANEHPLQWAQIEEQLARCDQIKSGDRE